MLSFSIYLEKVCKSYDISFSNTREKKTVLSNIDFYIEKGSTVILSGENSSGKSQLSYIIAGLEKPTSGKVKITGKVALILQDANIQILGATPIEDIEFSLKGSKISKNEIKTRSYNLLSAVDLLQIKDHPTSTLSGGQKRRLTVASQIAIGFDIIIFDEPYANLDYKSVHNVNLLIKDLKNQGKTIIIITHEIEKCLALADNVYIMQQGKICYKGTPQDTLNQDLLLWNIHNPLSYNNNLSSLLW